MEPDTQIHQRVPWAHLLPTIVTQVIEIPKVPELPKKNAIAWVQPTPALLEIKDWANKDLTDAEKTLICEWFWKIYDLHPNHNEGRSNLFDQIYVGLNGEGQVRAMLLLMQTYKDAPPVSVDDLFTTTVFIKNVYCKVRPHWCK